MDFQRWRKKSQREYFANAVEVVVAVVVLAVDVVATVVAKAAVVVAVVAFPGLSSLLLLLPRRKPQTNLLTPTPK